MPGEETVAPRDGGRSWASAGRSLGDRHVLRQANRNTTLTVTSTPSRRRRRRMRRRITQLGRRVVRAAIHLTRPMRHTVAQTCTASAMRRVHSQSQLAPSVQHAARSTTGPTSRRGCHRTKSLRKQQRAMRTTPSSYWLTTETKHVSDRP